MAFVIISAERAHLTMGRNAARTDELLTNIKENVAGGVLLVLGSYLGRVEQSIMVTLAEREDYEHLSACMRSYDQESILLVDDAADAWLVFQDGEIELIGKWAYAGLKAPNSDGWTYIHGLYFHCVKAPEGLPYGGHDGD